MRQTKNIFQLWLDLDYVVNIGLRSTTEVASIDKPSQIVELFRRWNFVQEQWYLDLILVLNDGGFFELHTIRTNHGANDEHERRELTGWSYQLKSCTLSGKWMVQPVVQISFPRQLKCSGSI
ncbi:hypothetical protein IV203_005384 [Nitzschia inconspicua]|uniref:Uncharacterized protein n=1 Tax=Nitzschia inconspicua TaxID=303405 RepID=A0A9K3PGW5_9STRA|nr:hypothetical protein IV203_005384 [Nitzschia inconspicua]